MSLEKNDMSKYIQNKSVREIINDFIIKRDRKKMNSSVTNSTAFSDCMASLGGDTGMSNDNVKISFSQLMDKKETITEKFKSYTQELKCNLVNRMDEILKNRNRNVDVMNYRYIDVETNNYIINILPRFKKIVRYNNKAQEYYTSGIIPRNNSPTRPSKINVAERILKYKTFFKK